MLLGGERGYLAPFCCLMVLKLYDIDVLVSIRAMARNPTKKTTIALQSVQSQMAQGTAQEEQSRLQAVMQEAKVFTLAYYIIVEQCAQMKVLRDLVYQILNEEELFIIEESREGSERRRAHPMINTYLEVCKELRQTLAELKLTPKNSSIPEGDALDELTQKLNSILYAEPTSRGAQSPKGASSKRAKSKAD